MTRIRAKKPVAEPAGSPVIVGKISTIVTYQLAPAVSGMRLYYSGDIRVATACFANDGSCRLSYAEPDCPTRVRDFKDEQALHDFLLGSL